MSLPAGVRRAPTAFVSVLAILATTLVAAAPAQAASENLFFSEYIEGSSNNKALEIYNGTDAPVDLAAGGYSVQMFFNGKTSAALTIALTGTVAVGDVHVLAQSAANAAILAAADQTNGAGWFNGDDAISLRRGTGVVDSIGQIGGDPGTQWGSDLTSTADNTLRRRATVTGGDTTPGDAFDPASEWDGFATDTFDGLGSNGGGSEEPPVSQPCSVTPTHKIGAVQGTGFGTPFAGQEVTVRGLVVGDLPGLGGFHLQEPDGDPATSDGIFIVSGESVSLGETVAVTGTAQEGFGQTQIALGSTGQVCDVPISALPEPALLDLPADAGARERLEGMLVTPVDVLTVSEVFQLTRFGELMLSEGGVLVQPTELARPGAAAQAIAAENVRRRIVLDDGRSPGGASVTNRPYLSPTTPVRVGDQLNFQEAFVLGYGFGQWRLQPSDGTADGTFTPQNTRPGTPGAVGGDMRVAAFNVLNYFLTFQDPPGRGADNAGDFAKQAAKIVPAIEALDAEVVTLMEIEDTDSTGYSPGDPDQAVADLVRRLNMAAGEDRWDYSPLPSELMEVERDVIRNAIIYQQHLVQPVGDSIGLVDEDVWFNAREPIAQTFAMDGDQFTVMANHFKSKSRGPLTGPDAATGDNVDAGDGQGYWNGDRSRQAASLATFTDRLRAQTADEDVLVMGDLNAYSQEDPIQGLRKSGFTDLGEKLDPGRYSYVFDALSGSLDHAMATDALTAKVTGVAHWNINAVESFAYQYSGDPALYAPDQYRSSDHDPLVLGIDLEERCNGLLPTMRGTDGSDVFTGTKDPDVIMGLGGNDVIDGSNADDVVCGGAGADTVTGSNGNDHVNGGFGDDTVLGGSGDDQLIGGPGADVLDGGHGVNTLEQDGAES